METWDRISNDTWPTGGEHLEAILTWLEAEERALAEGGDIPSVAAALSGWPVVLGMSSPDSVGLHIRGSADPSQPGQRPRFFDPAIAIYLRLAVAFGSGTGASAYVWLDQTPRKSGSVQFHPKLALSIPKRLKARGKRGWNIPVNRITVDAAKNKNVHWIGDHHHCERRNLREEFPEPPHKPGYQAQAEAEIALKALHSAANTGIPSRKRAMLQRDYLGAVRKALWLAYQREALRRTQEPEVAA